MHQAKQIWIAIILLLSVCQGDKQWVINSQLDQHECIQARSAHIQKKKFNVIDSPTWENRLRSLYVLRLGWNQDGNSPGVDIWGRKVPLFSFTICQFMYKEINHLNHKWTYLGTEVAPFEKLTGQIRSKDEVLIESPILWPRFDLSRFIAFNEGNLVVFRTGFITVSVRVDKSRLVKSNWLDSDVKSRKWWRTDDKAQDARLEVKHSRYIKEYTQRRRRRWRWRSDFRWFLFVDFCLMYDRSPGVESGEAPCRQWGSDQPFS